jgi:hypothetical protein
LGGGGEVDFSLAMVLLQCFFDINDDFLLTFSSIKTFLVTVTIPWTVEERLVVREWYREREVD